MRIGGIDPGEHRIAWGVNDADYGLVEGGLQDVENLKQIREFVASLNLDLLTVEQMTIYPGRRSVGDPNDFVRISHVAGACASAVDRYTLVAAGRWKGQVPKHIHHRRFRDNVLGLNERRRLDEILKPIATSLRHNVLDACALACWGSGRRG